MGGESKPVPDVGPKEALDLIQKGAVLLDVREGREWVAGHAPQATWMPMDLVPDEYQTLAADRPVVCVCHLGGRSAMITQALSQAGLDARNLAGGMQAWAAAGLPVIDDEGRAGVIV